MSWFSRKFFRRGEDPEIEIIRHEREDGPGGHQKNPGLVEFTLSIPGQSHGKHTLSVKEENCSFWITGESSDGSKISLADGDGGTVIRDVSPVLEPNVCELDVKKSSNERKVKGAIVYLGEPPKKIELEIEGGVTNEWPILDEESTRKYLILDFVINMQDENRGCILHPKQAMTNLLIKRWWSKRMGGPGTRYSSQLAQRDKGGNERPRSEEVRSEEVSVLYNGSDDCANLFSSYEMIKETCGVEDNIRIKYDIFSVNDGNDEHVKWLLDKHPELAENVRNHYGIGVENQGKYDVIIDTYTLPWAGYCREDGTKKRLSDLKDLLKPDGFLLLTVPVNLEKEPFEGSQDKWNTIHNNLPNWTMKQVRETLTNCTGYLIPHERATPRKETIPQTDGIVSTFQEAANIVFQWKGAISVSRAEKTEVTELVSQWHSGNVFPQRVLLLYGHSGWGKTSSVFSVLWPGTTQQQTNEVLLIRGDSVHEDKWRGGYETVVIDEIQDFPGSADEFMEIIEQGLKKYRFIIMGKRGEGNNPNLITELADHGGNFHEKILNWDVNMVLTEKGNSDLERILDFMVERLRRTGTLEADVRAAIIRNMSTTQLSPRAVYSYLSPNQDLSKITVDDVERWVMHNSPVQSTVYADMAQLFGIESDRGE